MRPWLFPGRFQPLHEGHIKLIRTLLDKGDNVVVGIFDTPKNKRNPYTIDERESMIYKALKEEVEIGRVDMITLPWIKGIGWGRDVGYKLRQIKLDTKTEQISGTNIRNGTSTST